MRTRNFVLGCLAAGATATSLSGCATLMGPDSPYTESVANVTAESNQPVAQLLAPYGYKPIVDLTYKSGSAKQTGTVYLACAEKYQRRVDKCADDIEASATDQHPGVVVLNGKLTRLIGGKPNARHNEHNRPLIDIPPTPVDAKAFPETVNTKADTTTTTAPSPSVTTWQDITKLSPAALHYLLTEVAPSVQAEASRTDDQDFPLLIDNIGQMHVQLDSVNPDQWINN